jgi:hypothetical protein
LVENIFYLKKFVIVLNFFLRNHREIISSRSVLSVPSPSPNIIDCKLLGCLSESLVPILIFRIVKFDGQPIGIGVVSVSIFVFVLFSSASPLAPGQVSPPIQHSIHNNAALIGVANSPETTPWATRNRRTTWTSRIRGRYKRSPLLQEKDVTR